MYAEKDSNEKIIIQDISVEMAEVLVDCICRYISEGDCSKYDKELRRLKIELEKLY